jgi:hypothetical protein
MSEIDRVHREMKMIECLEKVATSWVLTLVEADQGYAAVRIEFESV